MLVNFVYLRLDDPLELTSRLKNGVDTVEPGVVLLSAYFADAVEKLTPEEAAAQRKADGEGNGEAFLAGGS